MVAAGVVHPVLAEDRTWFGGAGAGSGNGDHPQETTVARLLQYFLLRNGFRFQLSRVCPGGALAFRRAGVDVAGLDLEERFFAQLG